MMDMESESEEERVESRRVRSFSFGKDTVCSGGTRLGPRCEHSFVFISCARESSWMMTEDWFFLSFSFITSRRNHLPPRAREPQGFLRSIFYSIIMTSGEIQFIGLFVGPVTRPKPHPPKVFLLSSRLSLRKGVETMHGSE